MEEYYFNLNLRNHTDEQLFHVELVNADRRFALMGKIDGHRQFWSGRYTIEEIEFYITNFNITRQNIKIDEVVFDSMTSSLTVMKVYCSDTDSAEVIRYTYNQVTLGVYRTKLQIEVYNKPFGSDEYRLISENENFGGHICKSRMTY